MCAPRSRPRCPVPSIATVHRVVHKSDYADSVLSLRPCMLIPAGIEAFAATDQVNFSIRQRVSSSHIPAALITASWQRWRADNGPLDTGFR